MADSTVTIDPTATSTVDNASNKPSPHSTTDKIQPILDVTNSSSKVSENGEKKNLPSPEATVSSVSLLSNSSTTQANSPSHKMKEQVLHSRDSSSDMSQTSDSQASISKESVVDPGATTSKTNITGEPKKQKSRDHDRDTDEQQTEPPLSSQPSQDSISQDTSKGDIPAKPPAQQQQQQPPPQLQQQKKTRSKGVSKSGKERRPLKLTITNINDDLVDCSLTNGGQTITFKFRLDADSSEAIAQGMVCHFGMNGWLRNYSFCCKRCRPIT